MEGNLDYCSPVLIDETIRIDTIKNNSTEVVIPDLRPQTSQPLFQAYDEQVTWNFSIRELNGEEAYNVWTVFTNPSGDIVPVSLVRNGNPISPVNNVYSLGNIPAGSGRGYTLSTSYNTCSDSLIVLVGWDCDGVPSSDQEALQGGLLCASDTLILYMEALPGNIQQEILEQPTGPVDPCTPIDYELEITNVGLGEIYEPVFELYVPV